MRTINTTLLMVLGVAASMIPASAAPVGLQSPTATYSQTDVADFFIYRAIDGISTDSYGWAISPNTVSQIAVFETVQDIGFPNASLLTFTMIHNAPWFDQAHNIGRFRLSVTADDRSLFADSLPSGGDVSANWSTLSPLACASANGTVLTALPDASILASGPAPLRETYRITAITGLTRITGIRLEVLEDPSLPFSGPGRAPVNGNFVLSEFMVDIDVIPEPGFSSLTGLFWASALCLRSIRRAQRV